MTHKVHRRFSHVSSDDNGLKLLGIDIARVSQAALSAQEWLLAPGAITGARLIAAT